MAIAHDDAEAPTLVLDGGTGLRRLSELLGGEPFRGTILFGHLHWDHTQGLPFFAAGDRPDADVQLLVPDQGDGPREPLGLLSMWMGRPLRSDDEVDALVRRLSRSDVRVEAAIEGATIQL